MPRQKHARRFETRFGVSQVMLDGEAKWLQRELDDHLIYSLTAMGAARSANTPIGPMACFLTKISRARLVH